MTFQTKNVNVVYVTDIFKDKPKLFDVFDEYAGDFTWGDNDMSLVTVERFIEALESAIEDINADISNEVKILIQELHDIKKDSLYLGSYWDFLIDLECKL